MPAAGIYVLVNLAREEFVCLGKGYGYIESDYPARGVNKFGSLLKTGGGVVSVYYKLRIPFSLRIAKADMIPDPKADTGSAGVSGVIRTRKVLAPQPRLCRNIISSCSCYHRCLISILAPFSSFLRRQHYLKTMFLKILIIITCQ
jgi:hypothetical protein